MHELLFTHKISTMTNYGLLACLLLPAVAAVIAPWLGRRTAWAGAWLALAPALLALWLGNQVGGEVLSLEFPWAPRYGLAWSFELTPLRMFMGLIVVSVGVPVSVYASSYFDDGRKRGRMLAFLYLFMTAMLGLVLSDNLVVVAIFWEATSVLSFLMIGFYNAKPEARRAAVDAFLVTGAGGLALVLAVVLLGQAGGSLAISELSLAREVIQSDSRYPLIVALVLIAVMTKSAQIPCHFWLPGAMTAPAPVSAFLHSATMVKAGIFLVLVLQPVLGDTALWQSSLMILGCVSMTL
ncbi:MAG: NADH:ubiquinone oxidoreductase subunit 5 (subunit L)/multisubunit Na+/H+ antiporter MnhA subunit, partial [Rhodothermales bacterium]